MPRKLLSAKEVEDKIQGDRPYISLDHSTFVKTTVKAKFIDSKYGEWWAKPTMVIIGRGHPKRGAKCSMEKFLVRLKPFNLDVDVDTYDGLSAKARFIDPIYGEFWAIPKNVLNGTRHRKRSLYEKCKKPKFTPEQVEKKIQETRPHIKIKPDSYTNTHIAATFIDDVFGCICI